MLRGRRLGVRDVTTILEISGNPCSPRGLESGGVGARFLAKNLNARAVVGIKMGPKTWLAEGKDFLAAYQELRCRADLLERRFWGVGLSSTYTKSRNQLIWQNLQASSYFPRPIQAGFFLIREPAIRARGPKCASTADFSAGPCGILAVVGSMGPWNRLGT